MNIAALNTTILVYIALMVFAIGAYILIITGGVEKKRASR